MMIQELILLGGKTDRNCTSWCRCEGSAAQEYKIQQGFRTEPFKGDGTGYEASRKQSERTAVMPWELSGLLLKTLAMSIRCVA
jgi:hypothetical protein